ncbi:MAG: ABC transporter substrate-binding protein [Methanobrevibacter sp.]|jgi:ABC-type nitrate/sulfonate/bicarbonate transport system substrate-binding protein|nr:ABC transporter substrate-binding protein [Methanobrevibacter sp.]
MVNKKLLLIVLAIIPIVVVVGVLSLSQPVDANAIKGAVTKDCSGTPWFVAKEKGFFDKYNVTLVDKGNIPPQQQPSAFTNGDLNVFDGHPDHLINFLKSGIKAKAVAVTGAEPINGSIEKRHMHWLVKEDSPLKNASDFKKFVEDNHRKVKVGVLSTGSCADLETSAWLRNNGVDPKSIIEYLVLPDNQQEQTLIQGGIDVSVLHPPFFYKAERDNNETTDPSKKLRILTTSTEVFGPAAGVTMAIVTEDYIKKHPDTVRKFIKAFLDANRWSNNNRQEAGEITSKNIGLPYTSNVHWYSPSGAFDATVDGYLQTWIDAMVADGLIKEGEFKPEDLYTTKFSDAWDTSLPDQ